MSVQQEELLRRAKAGDRDAGEALVVGNSGLIWSIARRYFGRGVDPEDLFQLGCLGFLKAVEGFDLDFGTQFSTYAVPKIAGEIRRFLRDDGTVKVSRSLKERAMMIRVTRQKLTNRLGREPTLSELSAETGLQPEEIATAETATGTAEVLWMANDGDAAVRRYFETPASRPDVLLIDIQMPGTSGLDAAREILATDPAARILFLTTFADQSYIAQAMGLGAKGYLIKQDVAAVGPALQAVMAGQVVLGAEVLGKLTERTPDPADSDDSRDTADSIEGLLGEREREITALVAEGLDNRDIAARLFLSEGTVRNRISAILDKLGLTNRTQLAILWLNAHR